jgi:hypothetical protein
MIWPYAAHPTGHTLSLPGLLQVGLTHNVPKDTTTVTKVDLKEESNPWKYHLDVKTFYFTWLLF